MSALSEDDRRKCMGDAYRPSPPGGSDMSMKIMALVMVLVLVGALSYDVVLSRIGLTPTKAVASPASPPTAIR